MNRQINLLVLTLFFFTVESYSQGFVISSPRLQFAGNQLGVSYDINSENQADKFFVWIEISRKNGEQIQAKTLTGDIGDNIRSGKGRKIIWLPEKDSVYLNEEILVEVKAEKKIKSFNKASMVLISTVVPGLGQTMISNGKPWWLAGVASYGCMAGGYISYRNSLKNYDSYLAETVDPLRRADLLAQSQKNKNISGTLIISGAAIWAANIIWVTITPNKYEPLKHVKLTLNQSPGPECGSMLLTLRFNF